MAYPVSLSEVKSHLRIDANYFEDDSYITDIIIPASVEYCTNFIDSSILYTDSSCPYSVKQAMLICVADLYDVERSSYTVGSIKRGDVIQRLLLPYKLIVW
jgi:hypothetical protein